MDFPVIKNSGNNSRAFQFTEQDLIPLLYFTFYISLPKINNAERSTDSRGSREGLGPTSDKIHCAPHGLRCARRKHNTHISKLFLN